jgi:hypothetical protein
MEINTDGVQRVGELVIRNYRALDDAGPGVAEAIKASRVHTLEEVSLWVAQQVAAAGPYDDVRALRSLSTWIADRIRETLPQETPNA